MLHDKKPLGFPPALWGVFKPVVYCAAGLLAACSPTGFEGAVMVETPAAEMSVMESPMVIGDDAPVVITTVRPKMASRRAPKSGVITAGDIDDALNMAAFQRFLNKAQKTTRLPAANLSRPVMLRLTGDFGKPAPGVRVTLRKPGTAEPFFSGYSGVNGDITVFPALHGAGNLRTVELRAFPQGQGDAFVQRVSSTGGRKQINLPFASSWKPDFLDLAFVVDTTGSMADELAWLTRELRGIVRAAKRSAPDVNVRYGLIVYRDQGDDYVVKNYGFTARQSEMQGWLRNQDADGGGDYPEAAAQALAAGAALNWRRGKGERLMFHIADAPPHDRDARAYLAAAKVAARNNVQIFGLGASGVAGESEYLMRQAAVQTNGRYLFLTDDSGVGNGHAEPTISCYNVTKLSGLMVRVLRSELSGKRIEAKGGDVIRRVGDYRAGVCRN